MAMVVGAAAAAAVVVVKIMRDETETTMWADAQRDGHPGKYRWRPLFHTTKFG